MSSGCIKNSLTLSSKATFAIKIFFKLERSLKRTDVSKECRRYSEDIAVAIISLRNNRLHRNALLYFKGFKT